MDLPKEVETSSFSEHGVTLTCQKRSVITISTQLDVWSRDWKMKLPEMVYGDNCLTVSFEGSESRLIFSPQHVLKNRCHADEFDPLLISFDSIKVDPSIKVHSDGYHWAFPSLSASGYDSSLEKECAGGLPYDILQQREEIRWYTQFLLFEDDLNDFGYVMTECRSRVMGKYFYILQQQYLRIDRRCIYVISHRYFYMFRSKEILHDFSVQKLDLSPFTTAEQRTFYEDVRNTLHFQDRMVLVRHRFSKICICYVC